MRGMSMLSEVIEPFEFLWEAPALELPEKTWAQLIIQAIKDIIDFVFNYIHEYIESVKQECKDYARAAELHLEKMLREQQYQEPDGYLFDWRLALKETV
jgi:hypothetical protein